MRIAADVIQDLLWTGKRGFSVDAPFGLLQRSDEAAKLLRVVKFFEGAEELKFAGVESLLELIEEQSTEQAREDAHGKKETGLRGNPTCSIG